MQKNEKVVCPYCGKDYKRITPKHLEKHGVTYDIYLKEYQPITYMENLLIRFFDDYYITFRSKYLLYTTDGKTYTINANKPIEKLDKETGEVVEHRPMKLVKRQLQQHLRQEETIGIFFPTIGTKIIGLDLDINDIEALNSIYSSLVSYINPTSILITSSGGKGFHIDVFLNKILSRDIVIKFYELILEETGLIHKQLELRGASEQGWKLPFGMHHKKKAYCGATNEFGVGISINQLEDHILSRTKEDINSIIDAVLISNESNGIEKDIKVSPEVIEILTDDEIIEFEDMTTEVTTLASYNNMNEEFIEDLALIYRNGFDGEGIRSKYTFKIALFLKSHMRFTKSIVIEEMYDWMARCKGYKASEDDFKKDIDSTIEKIFKDDLKLIIAAKEIKISKVEIKEILSVKCRTTQETRTLRLLYYMMFLHSKAYADSNGVFFMTLQQMQAMGASKTKRDLLRQIEKLGSLNKVYKYPTKRISRTKFAPSEYKLITLSDINIQVGARLFNMCDEELKCEDCIDKATDFLLTTRGERQQYRKGKCLICPYNKR